MRKDRKKLWEEGGKGKRYVPIHLFGCQLECNHIILEGMLIKHISLSYLSVVVIVVVVSVVSKGGQVRADEEVKTGKAAKEQVEGYTSHHFPHQR